MCKIMVMAGINKTNRKLALEFTKLMARQLTPGNSDGLGYAAVSTKGELFGERWLSNGDAFVNRPVHNALSKQETLMVDRYRGFIIPDIPPPKYNSFGVVDEENIAAVTLHTRLATSGKEFINTHPFVREGTSLIHNGVISNANDLQMLQSSCDSEAILNEYVDYRVMDNPENIQKVTDKLHGYYACAVFSKAKRHGVILDIFKDSRASLEAAYIIDLKTIVFSSRLSDIQSVCLQMGMEIGRVFKVSDNMMLRLDPVSGEVLAAETFTSRGFPPMQNFSRRQQREHHRRVHNVSEITKQTSDDGPTAEKGISYYDVYTGSTTGWTME
jgi:predicted glutamine amidotransferase